MITDDGRATLLDKDSKPVYSLGEAINAAKLFDAATWMEHLNSNNRSSRSSNSMYIGEILTPGKAIYSSNMYYRLKIGADGIVVVESAWGSIAWLMHTQTLKPEQSNSVIRPTNSLVAMALMSNGCVAIATIDRKLGWVEKCITMPPSTKPTGPLMLRLLDTGALQVLTVSSQPVVLWASDHPSHSVDVEQPLLQGTRLLSGNGLSWLYLDSTGDPHACATRS